MPSNHPPEVQHNFFPCNRQKKTINLHSQTQNKSLRMLMRTYLCLQLPYLHTPILLFIIQKHFWQHREKNLFINECTVRKLGITHTKSYDNNISRAGRWNGKRYRTDIYTRKKNTKENPPRCCYNVTMRDLKNPQFFLTSERQAYPSRCIVIIIISRYILKGHHHYHHHHLHHHDNNYGKIFVRPPDCSVFVYTHSVL